MRDEGEVKEPDRFIAMRAPFDVPREPLIGKDSPFLRLPAGLDRRQTIYFDGIRHAVEVAELAYARLVEELTRIAVSHRETPPGSMSFTPAFLDAWAIVDAIYRLRGLLHMLPGVRKLPRSDGKPSFRVQTEAIADLRNVADHLSQRVDYVVATDGTAMGRLTWVTVLDGEPVRMLSCAIVPGTIGAGTTVLANPAGQSFRDPSDLITLTAGGYSASLSDAMAEVRRVVGSLGEGLANWIRESGHEDNRAGADFLAVAVWELSDE